VENEACQAGSLHQQPAAPVPAIPPTGVPWRSDFGIKAGPSLSASPPMVAGERVKLKPAGIEAGRPVAPEGVFLYQLAPWLIQPP